jgi:hypothetical protein
LKREYSAEGYLAPEAAQQGTRPSYLHDWYAAGQVLLKLLQRCTADGDARGKKELEDIANAMYFFVCTHSSIIVSNLRCRHNDDDIDREDLGNPSLLLKKLNPEYQEIATPAADDDECSQAVFAFIQSFFSN